MAATYPHLHLLCKDFMHRVNMYGLKGKKADTEAIAFFVGAACTARLLGNEDLAKHIELVNYMVFSIRGLPEVKRIAEHPVAD